MCGIVGQLRFDDAGVDRSLVQRMASSLRYRGPDGSGFHFDRRIGLGHRRLALVDPKGPGQPIGSDDGSLWLTGNHEIYNYRELRKDLERQGHRFRTSGDAEVILRLFESIGVDAFSKLTGMFALALWDAKSETLYLARDPFGIKPLHYTRGTGGTFLFASEMRALLCDDAVGRSIDPLALDGYLRSLSVPEPRSILQSVSKVPAGHFLQVTRHATKAHRYFELEVGGGGKTGSEAELVEEFRLALDETVWQSLHADVEVGCFLSGGVDSSALLAASSRLYDRPIRTYSLGFDEPAFDERPYSRLVSEAFNSRHCEVRLSREKAVDIAERIVDHLDEPFADSSALPTFALAERAAQDLKAVLSGEGMDELCAGGIWHGPDFAPVSGDQDEAVLEDPRRAIFNTSALAGLYLGGLPGGLQIEPAAKFKPETTVFAKSAEDRRLAFDLRTYLPSDLLVKMDRLPMASSLEVRVPFLNVPFARLLAGMDISMKIRDGTQKYLFKKMLKGVVPDAILDRPKQGFAIPLDIWLWQDGCFREMVHDVLGDSRTRQRGLFDNTVIQTMLDEHGRLERFHGYRLWTLFVFEMWQRRVQDSPSVPIAAGLVHQHG